ncbi:hypothetical protein ACFL16_00760 [Patescibacteria group bacterium]
MPWCGDILDGECWEYMRGSVSSGIAIYKKTKPKKVKEVEYPSDVLSYSAAKRMINGFTDNPLQVFNGEVEFGKIDFFAQNLTMYGEKVVQYATYYPERSLISVNEPEKVSVFHDYNDSTLIGFHAFILKYLIQVVLFGVFLFALFTEYSFGAFVSDDFFLKFKGRWAKIFFDFRGFRPNVRIACIILLLIAAISLTNLVLTVSGGIIIAALIIIACSVLAGFFSFCGEKLNWTAIGIISGVFGAFLIYVVCVSFGTSNNYLYFFAASAVSAWLLANFFYFGIKYILIRSGKKSVNR